jgi:hypothetical protein
MQKWVYFSAQFKPSADAKPAWKTLYIVREKYFPHGRPLIPFFEKREHRAPEASSVLENFRPVTSMAQMNVLNNFFIQIERLGAIVEWTFPRLRGSNLDADTHKAG